MTRHLVVTLYEFAHVADGPALIAQLQRETADTGILGLLIVATEGLNGTIAGPEDRVRSLVSWLTHTAGFKKMRPLETWVDGANPFLSLKIQLRNEAVTLGSPTLNPQHRTGTHIPPRAWDALISQPDVVLIDVRNDYEWAIGSFPGAEKPDTAHFRSFPEWVEANHEHLSSHGGIAMYCTGGIRCEKASAYLLKQGYDNVYQLEGGILNYLKEVPERTNRWEGECYVFDGRVSLDRSLRPGRFTRCPACRHPIDDTDRGHPDFVAGVSCPHCISKTTKAQKARFAERAKQMRLAKERGEHHLVINSGFDKKRDDRSESTDTNHADP